MFQAVHSIEIKGELNEVFKIAADLEGHAELSPEFTGLHILKQEEHRIIYERTVNKLGLNCKFTSQATFEGPKAIKFVHLDGFLKGMSTEWRFEEISGGTKVTAIHTLATLGSLIDKLIYNIFIKNTANRILKNMKQKIEGTLKN